MKAVVITTINPPTATTREVRRWAVEKPLGRRLFVVGDEPGPDPVDYFPFELLEFSNQVTELAKRLPTRHYARKNLGYVAALAAGARWVLDLDDDNVPTTSRFYEPFTSDVARYVIERPGWVNAYRFFTTDRAWPRGLPLAEIDALLGEPTGRDVICPVVQSLVSGDPDLDAIYRLTQGSDVHLHDVGQDLVIAGQAYCPFNSQATAWVRHVFPLLYLPGTVSSRVSDIWRSLVAQRIMHEEGWGVRFTAPTVRQDRNPHDLQRDLEEEVPLYTSSWRVREVLEATDLSSFRVSYVDERLLRRLVICYGSLARHGLVEPRELLAVHAWCEAVGDALGR